MPWINKTGKSKGFAFIVTTGKVHQDLLKLGGIDLLDRKISIKEAISTRKKDPKQNKRPNFVVNNFQKIKIYSNDPELYVATSCKSAQHMKKGIIQDSYKERKFF